MVYKRQYSVIRYLIILTYLKRLIIYKVFLLEVLRTMSFSSAGSLKSIGRLSCYVDSLSIVLACVRQFSKHQVYFVWNVTDIKGGFYKLVLFFSRCIFQYTRTAVIAVRRFIDT